MPARPNITSLPTLATATAPWAPELANKVLMEKSVASLPKSLHIWPPSVLITTTPKATTIELIGLKSSIGRNHESSAPSELDGRFASVKVVIELPCDASTTCGVFVAVRTFPKISRSFSTTAYFARRVPPRLCSRSAKVLTPSQVFTSVKRARSVITTTSSNRDVECRPPCNREPSGTLPTRTKDDPAGGAVAGSLREPVTENGPPLP